MRHAHKAIPTADTKVTRMPTVTREEMHELHRRNVLLCHREKRWSAEQIAQRLQCELADVLMILQEAQP